MDVTSDQIALVETWKRELVEKAFRMGLFEGFRDGFLEGCTDQFVRLLLKRFGPLDAALRAQIKSADPEAVERWFDRAVDAPDLSSVFQLSGE